MEVYSEALFRTTLSFFAILIYARLLGKQQMSQLTFYDYVTGITFGNIAASLAIEPGSKSLLFLWVLTVFTALNYLMGVITEKSRPLRKLIEGEPTIVIHNGKILEHNMGKSRYNIDNLTMQLRTKDIFNIQDVEFAIAETDGTLTVLKKSLKRPVTPGDLNISPPYEGIPSEIIMDGQVIYQNLLQNNLDESWLIMELKKYGYNDPRQIAYASLDVNGNLYIDKHRDELNDVTDISD